MSGGMIAILIVLGIIAWGLVHASGVHATIAGVALGLLMSDDNAAKTRHALEPVSNGIILPVFAFFAALVTLPSVSIAQLSPVFWAILIALPVGKLIGITAGATIAAAASRQGRGERLPLADVVAVAGLGGIGFTVSLLMNELAYEGDHEIATEGTLAVLAASVVAAVIGVILISARARAYRRAA